MTDKIPEALAVLDQAAATYDNLRFERRDNPKIVAFWTTRIEQAHKARASFAELIRRGDYLSRTGEGMIAFRKALAAVETLK
jgi:hypothetical protein